MIYKIEIKKLEPQHLEEVLTLLYTVIKDNFTREGIDDEAWVVEEVNDKRKVIQRDFDSQGQDAYFLIACHDGKIVGIIALAPPTKAITDETEGKLDHVFEIGSVYILPEYQGQGIGKKLMNSMYISMISRGIKEFCLDSGYTLAKQYWANTFGPPAYIIKDYWGEGYDNHIWHIQIQNVKIVL